MDARPGIGAARGERAPTMDAQDGNAHVYARANDQLQGQRPEDRIECLSECYARARLKAFAAAPANRDRDPEKPWRYA
eukprot:4974691-Pyramimonas_sp.AAC.1